ncbi:UNVERIFIED_CONTAM: hypothetical protein FKN15_069299 [Acipenser sinensis]
MASPGDRFEFAIDRGGTFTDVFARCPGGKVRVLKLLSEDPANYRDAPTEGIRRVLEEECGQSMPRNQPLDTSLIGWIRMGTTVATNALLERKGEKMALLITRGFRDLLHIGNQARPRLFDLEIVTPEVLYEEVIEVEERVVLQRDGCQLPRREAFQTVTGSTGERLEVWTPPDLVRLEADLRRVLSQGIRSLAVVLMHSYTWSSHEVQVGALARRLGFQQVSLSCEVMPMVRIVPRGYTACADAYLTPKIQEYLSGFRAGFCQGLQGVRVLFMQSDGGLTPMEKFNGSRAILSGPAGGVVGYAMTSYSQENQQPVIGFDMGGTSTDVSRYAGQYEHVFEATTAGITVQAPQLDINTVAAGGGSRLFFRSGMFVVGPESAGAHPGPACYRKGGPLTVTDANLALGRLLPSFFPRIFGTSEDQPLSSEDALREFRLLTATVNHFLSTQPGASHSEMSVEEVAMGFIRVANEAMCRPIRALTQAKGHDTSHHVLSCFGGAGGQHACAIARALGMRTVFIHKYRKEFGFTISERPIVVDDIRVRGTGRTSIDHQSRVEPRGTEPRVERVTQCYFDDGYLDTKVYLLEELSCDHSIPGPAIIIDKNSSEISTEVFLHLRYERTDCALMCSAGGYPGNKESCSTGDFRAAFTDRYRKEFGFTISERPIVVDDIRVRGTGRTSIDHQSRVEPRGTEPRVERVPEGVWLHHLGAAHRGGRYPGARHRQDQHRPPEQSGTPWDRATRGEGQSQTQGNGAARPAGYSSNTE